MQKAAKAYLMVLVLGTVCAISAGPALTQKKSARAKSSDYATFKKLIDQYYTAWSTMDTEKAAPLYAKEPDLVFYDLAPLKYSGGWEEYKAGVQKAFFDGAESAKLTPYDDLRVTRKAGIAWTTVTFHLSAKMKDGSSMNLEGRHTAVWELVGGKWLIVHEHVSAPLPG